MTIASIDIGTNTVRLLISEKDSSNNLRDLYIDRSITRLGEGFSNNKRLLTTKAVNRTTEALKSFSKIINQYKVSKVRAVATSVVRESENGHKFLKKAQDEAGIQIEVISGEEEAQLMVSGVLNSVSFRDDHCILFDIGGGSTEYVYASGTNIINLISTRLGVVRLTEEFLKEENSENISQLTEFIKETLQSELNSFEINPNEKLSLIGTAGTPTTLAAIELGLKNYDPELVNNFTLTTDIITKKLENLLEIPEKERINVAGLEKGREDIIIPGAIIVLETMKIFSTNELIVSEGGVLEGIAYSQI